MTNINKFITGAGGQWFNTVMWGLLVFAAAEFWGEFKGLQEDVNSIMSNDTLQEWRIKILESKNP